MTEREKNLSRALSMCLETMHDYFGLTDKVMAIAIEDAATNPNWSPYDDKRWEKAAYGEAADGGKNG